MRGRLLPGGAAREARDAPDCRESEASAAVPSAAGEASAFRSSIERTSSTPAKAIPLEKGRQYYDEADRK